MVWLLLFMTNVAN